MRRVAVIGPGRVGGALALALTAHGDEVVAVSGGGDAARERFRALVPDAVETPVEQAAERADLVLVCTPDDVIEDVVRRVAAADGVRDGQRWVHTSGGKGLSVMSAAAAAGARTAACHPAMTFPDPRTGARRLGGTSWAVTTTAADQAWAAELVEDLGGVAVPVAERDRVLYHAALAIGSNATTAVVTLARDLLQGAGIADPSGFLEPLVSASAVGAARDGVQALTGPVRRGDAGTVDAHLAELRAVMPEAVEIYQALGRLILSHAVRAGLTADQATAVARALDPDGRADRQA